MTKGSSPDGSTSPRATKIRLRLPKRGSDPTPISSDLSKRSKFGEDEDEGHDDDEPLTPPLPPKSIPSPTIIQPSPTSKAKSEKPIVAITHRSHSSPSTNSFSGKPLNSLLTTSTRYGAVRRPGLARKTNIPSLLNHRGPPPLPRPPPQKKKKANDEDDYVYDPDYEALIAKNNKDDHDSDQEDDDDDNILKEGYADVGVVDDEY